MDAPTLPASPENPFAAFQISSFDFLKQMSREQCPGCNGSRKYICYECLRPMGDPANFPKVKLPIGLDILHWPSELRSKSTATHACVIAPEDTRFIDHPDIPEYEEGEAVILFPSDNAPSVADFPDLSSIKRVVFVDSQWHSANKILREPAIQKLKHIKITKYKTMFWRYQQCGDECLATIEEYHIRMTGGYNGEYDNLLFFYAFNHSLIQNKYKEEKAFFPRIQNYVHLEGQTQPPLVDRNPQNSQRLNKRPNESTTDKKERKKQKPRLEEPKTEK